MLIAACGAAGNESGSIDAASATTEIPDEMDMETADTAIDEVGSAEGEHEHEQDDAPDAIPWDGSETPQVEVSVTGDAGSGWDIVASVTGFSFSNPSKTEHLPGEGHTHVFVDGRLISMSYEPVVHVDHLEPGVHQAVVTLSRNDHTDYSLDGELIMAMAAFTVTGDVEAADATILVMYMNGEVTGVEGRPAVSVGDTVEITVHSDVADVVHVHGYDLFLELDAGEADSVRFEADIPGIFEVELEDAGALLLEFQVS